MLASPLMAKIFNLFSIKDEPGKGFSLAEANRLVPLLRKYTEEAIRETGKISAQLDFHDKASEQYKSLSAAYDNSVMKWAETMHRIGGLAKGLWTVDFDSGEFYFCWTYPERRIDHFHQYDETFKARKKLDNSAEPPEASSSS
jgi:hypothetical protein